MGSTFSDRGRRTNEYIRAIRELWCSPEPRFEGKYVNFADVVASPRPLQPGGPPIWIGGKSDAALARAAALGDGWHPNYIGTDELRLGLLKLRSMKIRSNRFAVSVRERVRILSLGEEPRQGGRSSIMGTTGEVVEGLKRLSAAGIDHFVSVPMARGQEDFEDQVKRFAEVIAGLSL